MSGPRDGGAPRRLRRAAVIDIDSLYVSMVEEGDISGAEAPSVHVASVERDQVQLNDTQLVMEDGEGTVLVYPDFDDVLEVHLDRRNDRRAVGDVLVPAAVAREDGRGVTGGDPVAARAPRSRRRRPLLWRPPDPAHPARSCPNS